jgi:hypothetical protein
VVISAACVFTWNGLWLFRTALDVPSPGPPEKSNAKKKGTLTQGFLHKKLQVSRQAH